eukprot:3156574-Pyramimonas_sp.AAC.1
MFSVARTASQGPTSSSRMKNSASRGASLPRRSAQRVRGVRLESPCRRATSRISSAAGTRLAGPIVALRQYA